MEKGSIVKRNAGLDVLKLICAFLVICIHATFAARDCLEPVTRAAVPVFFMITGWFYADERARQKKQIFKVLWIIAVACTFYALWKVLMTLRAGDSVRELIVAWLEPKALVKLILFNQTVVSTHLWYLFALLYVLIIAAVLGERGRSRVYWMIPLLLAAAVALGAYSPVLLGRKLSTVYGRNFLFTGLPCFLLGELLCQKREKLRFNSLFVLAMLVLSVVLATAERTYLINRTGYTDAELYICSVFIAISLFLLACNADSIGSGPVLSRLARWGEAYTLGIYILHPAVIDLIQMLFGGLFSRSYTAAKLYYYTAPLVLLIFAAVLTAMLKAVRKWLPSR